MSSHNTFRMISVNFAAHAHRYVADFAEKFIFILFIIITIPKIQNRIILNNLPIMFSRNLILVMFIITLLAEIYLLSKAIYISLLVLTLLAFYQLRFLVLLLSKGKLNQIVWQGLHLLVDLYAMAIDLILVCAFLVNYWVKTLRWAEALLVGLRWWDAGVAFSGTYLYDE